MRAGVVDNMSSGLGMSGWVVDPAAPDGRAAVDILVDGERVARVEAHVPRADVQAHLRDAFGLDVPVASGFFSKALMAPRLEGREVEVRVCFAGTDEPLTNGVARVRCGAGHLHALFAAELAGYAGWNPAHVDVEGGMLRLSGMAAWPRAAEDTPVLHVGGHTMAGASLMIQDGGGADEVLWFLPDHRRVEFTAEAPLPPPDDWPAEGLSVTLSWERRGTPLHPWQRVVVPRPQDGGPPVPGHEEQARIFGQSVGAAQFEVSGYSTLRTMWAVIAATDGRRPQDFRAVLDWGCGCGRVLRWLAAERAPEQRLAGSDMDPLNVSWCAAHLTGCEVHRNGPHPPLPFADGAFDLVLGHSVITHIPLDVAETWFAELDRVLAPGGIAYLTFQGAYALLCSAHALGADSLERVATHGADDSSHDANVRLEEEPDYYRAVFHTPDHLRALAGRRFEVVAIEPAAYSHFQDVAVLRKRG
ncbi:MAG TPA: class I SAM-dependent methyltransferase [Azospirillum sp.]|nr:class I SAM-dependent methyltransferase [Azospirillum sp.]